MFDILRIRRAYRNHKNFIFRLKRFGDKYKRHSDAILNKGLTILTVEELQEAKRITTMAKDAYVASEKEDRAHRYILAWFQEWGFFLPKDDDDENGLEEG